MKAYVVAVACSGLFTLIACGDSGGAGSGVCGDLVLDPDQGEACDDGNTTSGDGCSATCQFEAPPFCGDAIVGAGETCDDGNTTSGDGCSSDCRSTEACGNGVVDVAVGETCDDGNTTDGDGCQADCALPTCGDGVLDPGEACDDGNAVDGDGCSAACDSNEACGNGVLDPGESCDDGNTADGDGCSAACGSEFCGNGAIDGQELCDDGNNTPGDGCSANCASDETCGNGVLDPAESCEDGNAADGDGCSAACVSEFCGNGAIDGQERCDDGNTTPGDGCSASCASDETCGNAVLDPGELCEDGNTSAGDGCDAQCRPEVPNDPCAGIGTSVLLNAGFETGSLVPWTSSTAATIQGQAYAGTYAAETVGNHYLEQSFPATPVTELVAARFWTWHGESAPMYVEWGYSDGTTGNTVYSSLLDWQEADILSLMNTSKSLNRVRVWGYSGGGGLADIVRYDQFRLCR